MSALDELKEAAISQQDLEARGFKLIQLHESDSLVDQPIQEAEIREVEDEQQLIIETETESMDPSTKDSSELNHEDGAEVADFATGKAYRVEALLDAKLKKGKQLAFLVHWSGYDPSEATWEPRCNLIGCDELVADFFASNPVKASKLKVALGSAKKKTSVVSEKNRPDALAPNHSNQKEQRPSSSRVDSTTISCDFSPYRFCPSQGRC